jgi:hypothetical protein
MNSNDFYFSPTTNVSGKWETPFGAEKGCILQFTQQGNLVTGTYMIESRKVNIQGTLSGNILRGEWAQSPTYQYPNDRGQLVFFFDPQVGNPTKFEGYWSYGTNLRQQAPQFFFRGQKIQSDMRQHETVEVYEPYIKIAVASQLLQDKVLPLLQQGQSKLSNDAAVKNIMIAIDAAFKEATDKLDPLHDAKTEDLGRLLKMVRTKGFLPLLNQKPSQIWKKFAKLANTVVVIFKLIAPGMKPSHMTPVFALRQMDTIILTLFGIVAGSFTTIMVKDSRDSDKIIEYTDKYIVPMNDCFTRYAHLIPPLELKQQFEVGKLEGVAWKKVEDCLLSKYKKTQEEVATLMYKLKESYKAGKKLGLYTPKAMRKRVSMICTDNTWHGAKEIKVHPAWIHPSCGSWVWSVSEKSPNVNISKTFQVENLDNVFSVKILFAVDNYGTVTINGQSFIKDTPIDAPTYYNPGREINIPLEFLKQGDNTIIIEGYNLRPDSPAGLYAMVTIETLYSS